MAEIFLSITVLCKHKYENLPTSCFVVCLAVAVIGAIPPKHKVMCFTTGRELCNKTLIPALTVAISSSRLGDCLYPSKYSFYTVSSSSSSSSSSYFIFQHNIKQIKIITVEYKNMLEGCQKSKRSLNWPFILLYD